MDYNYWQGFYSEHSNLTASPFAWEVAGYLNLYSGVPEGHILYDVGSGDGRDSFFLADAFRTWCHVVGIEQCPAAFELYMRRVPPNNSDRPEFVQADFTSFAYQKHALSNSSANFSIYSRFSLHSLTETEEKTFFENILSQEGLTFLFIEARSIRDMLCGVGTEVARNTWHTDHNRRFIDEGDLASLLLPHFNILYMASGTGFSPTAKEDPNLIRVVAKRKR